MKFDPEKIKQAAKDDFDAAWNQGKEYITQPAIPDQYPRFKLGYGKPHPIYDTIQKLREAYLHLGFTEAANPLIVDDKEIHKQFGYEALAVLDRCFYLAGLPRPNVGISDERIARVREIIRVDDEGIDTIRQILHSYKKGEIEGDDLVPEIAHKLDVPGSKVAVMLDHVFPEFKELIPVSSGKTLRSHMTSGWFISLGAMIERTRPPVRLFSVDRCFRREQQEDATRLMTYFSASCIIMDPEVTVEHGKAVAAALLSQFGFEKESRIEALSMIIVLCLFFYSIAQWKLRSRLKETNKYIRNQVKKPTESPTMRWVFFLFRGITELKILLDGIVEKRVANMTDELWDILSLMGKECEKYYV